MKIILQIQGKIHEENKFIRKIAQESIIVRIKINTLGENVLAEGEKPVKKCNRKFQI